MWVQAQVGSNQRLWNCPGSFFAKQAAFRSKSKDWLAQNHDSVWVEQHACPHTVVSVG